MQLLSSSSSSSSSSSNSSSREREREREGGEDLGRFLVEDFGGLLGAQGNVLEASDCTYSKGERKNLRFYFFFAGDLHAPL